MAEVVGWRTIEFKVEGWNMGNHKEEVDKNIVFALKKPWSFG